MDETNNMQMLLMTNYGTTNHIPWDPLATPRNTPCPDYLTTICEIILRVMYVFPIILFSGCVVCLYRSQLHELDYKTRREYLMLGIICLISFVVLGAISLIIFLYRKVSRSHINRMEDGQSCQNTRQQRVLENIITQNQTGDYSPRYQALNQWRQHFISQIRQPSRANTQPTDTSKHVNDLPPSYNDLFQEKNEN